MNIELERTGELYKLLERAISVGVNLRPVWLRWLDFYKKYVYNNWNKRGANMGKVWKVYSRQYRDWKVKKGHPSFVNLILNGRLKEAARGRDSAFYEILRNQSLEFGIELPYASAIQYGSRKINMPERPYYATKNRTLPAKAIEEMSKILLKQFDKQLGVLK